MGLGATTRRTSAFAHAARCYWLEVFPQVRRELRCWRSSAEAIPDQALRHDALFSHRTKSRHAEGLAAFAVLAPAVHRHAVVRATVAFEVMLDYLDTVSEHPSDDAVANSLKLHRAFTVAVDLEAQPEDYYALQAQGDDAGYLAALVAACREALNPLPSYPIALEALRRCAGFSAQAQSFNHAIPFGLDEGTVAVWASETAATIRLDQEIKWWEIVAAGSSSLAIGALIAAASDPITSPEDVALIEAAYFPWVTALSTLLDSLIDVGSDEIVSNHLNRYASQAEATEHLAAIATRSLQLTSNLPQAELHKLILAGLGGYYLAQPQAWLLGWDRSAKGVLDALGEFARPALGVHCLRQGRPRAAFRALARR
jgi:tetraprenyl-beta-curcumene synthase